MIYSGMCINGPLAGQLVQSPQTSFEVLLLPDGPVLPNDEYEAQIAQMAVPPERMKYTFYSFDTERGPVAFFVPSDQTDHDAFSMLANAYRGFIAGNSAGADNLALTMAALIMAAGGRIEVPAELINDGLKGMSIHKHQAPDERSVIYSVTKTEPGRDNR